MTHQGPFTSNIIFFTIYTPARRQRFDPGKSSHMGQSNDPKRHQRTISTIVNNYYKL